MSGLGAVIAARVAEWGGAELPLERLTFGTTDPDAIATRVDTWCREHLGSGIAHYQFFDSSSGSVHGVHLLDGRDVVVKVHRPDLTLAYLEAITRVRRLLGVHGLPAPEPLAGPVPYGPGHLTAERMLRREPRPDGHDVAVRRALAHGLAHFVESGRTLGLDHLTGLTHPAAMPPDALYPRPHSARFDFDATAAGSEWIDDLARRARAAFDRADHGPEVLVHGDWRIENVHVSDREVVAIYDWDSVCIGSELCAVATAATTFCVDWTRPAGEHFPSNSEMRAFVADYEIARGAPFSATDHHTIAARMVYGLCYGARCERADAYPAIADSQQGLLRRLGDALLADGLAALDD